MVWSPSCHWNSAGIPSAEADWWHWSEDCCQLNWYSPSHLSPVIVARWWQSGYSGAADGNCKYGQYSSIVTSLSPHLWDPPFVWGPTAPCLPVRLEQNVKSRANGSFNYRGWSQPWEGPRQSSASSSSPGKRGPGRGPGESNMFLLILWRKSCEKVESTIWTLLNGILPFPTLCWTTFKLYKIF